MKLNERLTAGGQLGAVMWPLIPQKRGHQQMIHTHTYLRTHAHTHKDGGVEGQILVLTMKAAQLKLRKQELQSRLNLFSKCVFVFKRNNLRS